MSTRLPANPSANPSPGSRFLFVVDDEPMIGQLVGTFLEMEGFEVKVFTDPQVALEAFQNSPRKPSVLLTDFQMGPINGLELIQECKALDPALKTMSISGTVAQEDLAQYPINPDRIVRKPFLPQELLAPLRELLNDPPTR